ncbi:MAG: hypothetical protein KIT09_26375 [Bryobacteraceae bacterium]|nr:hypothetical protein [Bryobacteraceae bacterium]
MIAARSHGDVLAPCVAQQGEGGLARPVMPLRRRLERLVPIWFAVCFLCWALIYVSPRHSFDDADPEILNQAWRLANGKTIYPAIGNPPYVHNAYTPLYYLLVGEALRRTGLSYLPAAGVTLAASVAALAAFIELGRRWRGSWREGAWTGCLFFLVPAVLYNSVRTHPQMLAVALALWGLALASRNRFLPTAVLSPLFGALAIYTKHSVVALPLAIAAWLLFRNRRWLPAYLLTLGAAVTLPFLWLQKETGGNFWLDAVKFNAIGYSIRQIPLIMIHHAGPLFLFIGAAAAAAWRRLRPNAFDLADLYFFAAALTTIAACGRTGAHTQYVIEFCAAALALLLRTSGIRSMPGRNRLAAAQILVLLVYTPLYVALENGPFALESRRAAAAILPLVSGSRGPIISQQGGFALFGSGEIYIQLGHFVNLSRAGLWDRNKIVLDIDNRQAEWVITQFDVNSGALTDDDRERFTPDIIEAIRRDYRLEKVVAPYYLYRPRGEAAARQRADQH